jgi:hypothetical protein
VAADGVNAAVDGGTVTVGEAEAGMAVAACDAAGDSLAPVGDTSAIEVAGGRLTPADVEVGPGDDPDAQPATR